MWAGSAPSEAQRMVDQDNIDQRCSFVGRAARTARIGSPRTMHTLERPR
jgi:hypothetical protein